MLIFFKIRIHLRGVEACDWHKYSTYWGHVGIYAFRAEILKCGLTCQTLNLESRKTGTIKILEAGYEIKL